MMNSLAAKSAVVTVVLLLLSVVILLVAAPKDRSSEKYIPTKEETSSSIADLNNSLSHKIDGREIAIESSTTYHDRWMIVVATLLTEPHDGEMRKMAYVIHIQDDGSLDIVAHTNHGFDEDNFPENTPKDVIEEALKL